MKMFISHESSDYNSIKPIVDLFHQLFGKYFEFYNSSEAFEGSNPKDDVHTNISKEMTNADIVVVFSTPNYICAEYCLYEISVAAYLNKPIYVLNFSQKSTDSITKIIGRNIVYIDCLSQKGFIPSMSTSLYSIVKDFKLDIGKSTITQSLEDLDFTIGKFERTRYFIGSTNETTNMEEYCRRMGIYEFRNTSIDMDTLKANLKNVKELYIVSTTGYDLISKLSTNILKQLLKEGTNVYIFNAEPNSKFLSDIAAIEDENNAKNNLKRLNDEINNCQVLIDNVITGLGKENKGNVKFYSVETLLRQTITLVVYNDDTTWGWMLTTIPPNRTRDNTPFFMFKNSGVSEGLSKILYSHIYGLLRANDRKPSLSFEYDYENEDVWLGFLNKAKVNTLEDKNDSEKEGCLIEIAAQHPLKPNGVPGAEFAKRLDRGIELFNDLKDKEPVYIYVPGSIHDDSGVSLSDAGKKYLIEHGVPEQYIFGNDEQEQIMKQDGVYNSFEECYVSYQLYKANNFNKIYSICSPYQMNRKILFYMYLGIIVEAIPVYCNKMWHNIVKESFEDIPFLLSQYSTYNEENYFDSIVFKNARKERKQ